MSRASDGLAAEAVETEDIPETDFRFAVRGWHAGRGPGKEPPAASGEFHALWTARLPAAEQIEAALAGAGDDPDALKRALLRAFDLGWRAGRAFEWERRERAVRETSQTG